jgi:hypothetical protein
MALTRAGNTRRMGTTPIPDTLEVPVKANHRIYKGGLVVRLAADGLAESGAAGTTFKTVGVAEDEANNLGGAAGAIRVRCRRGVFRFKNSSAGDLIVQADFLKDCFVVDDETVAKTNGGSTRSVAGRVMGVDAAGVWVEIL